MQKVSRWRGMSDEDCYSTFNGGQGALLVCEKEYAESVRTEAAYDGISARFCGFITERSEPEVRISSKFNGGEVFFRPD
jgi:phosphoribosylaminoimidazole (AIR) synthetase